MSSLPVDDTERNNHHVDPTAFTMSTVGGNPPILARSSSDKVGCVSDGHHNTSSVSSSSGVPLIADRDGITPSEQHTEVLGSSHAHRPPPLSLPPPSDAPPQLRREAAAAEDREATGVILVTPMSLGADLTMPIRVEGGGKVLSPSSPSRRIICVERGRPDVPCPPMLPLTHLECFDLESNAPNCEIIRDHFFRGGALAIGDALLLIKNAERLFRAEPNVLEINDPITICGDIHGQYYDLMTAFGLGGPPESTQYLFLGDYVDRGCFSTEVALYLFALKVARPKQIFLLRGNHECRHLTSYFNFKDECLHKYNQEVYDAFQSSFDTLPLAALLNSTFLCVHGGLSPDIRSVDDISLIERFREPPSVGPMCDLLWSDPMEDEEEKLCPGSLFMYNELRGCSYVFSHRATQRFLDENKLTGLIRAHEAQDEGFRMFRKMPESGFPAVICVFSAPNYCDSYDNKASLLQITDKKVLHLRQFHSVEHPYVLPNFMNAFKWSLPFVSDKLIEILLSVSGGIRLPPTPNAPTSATPVQGSSGGGGGEGRMTFPMSSGSSSRGTSGEGGRIQSAFAARGNVIYAKVVAAVRFITLLKRVRTTRSSAAAAANRKGNVLIGGRNPAQRPR